MNKPVISRYTISALPEGHHANYMFSVDVERRPGGRWVVTHFGGFLGADGRWDYGPEPTDEWRAEHWHTFDDAVRLAQDALSQIRVNGLTADDVRDR